MVMRMRIKHKLKIRWNKWKAFTYLWAGRVLSLSLKHLFFIRKTKTHTLKIELVKFSSLNKYSHFTAHCFFCQATLCVYEHESVATPFSSVILFSSLVVMYLFACACIVRVNCNQIKQNGPST